MLRKKHSEALIYQWKVDMSENGKFLIFCIEQYRTAKGLTGKETMNLFEKFKVLEYLNDSYGALHTTGINYIIDDIDEYILVRSA